jgi:hypothetical protein
MEYLTLIRCTLLASALVSASAGAYESEDAVPLSLGLEAGAAVVEGISIKLDGRRVNVLTTLQNSANNSQKIGWYASTPLFSLLGDGEEHADKSFADISARFNDQPRTPLVYQRGYFMGRDITAKLAKVGLTPLPDVQSDAKKLARLTRVQGLRPEQWQGYAAYSWSESLPAHSSTSIAVTYRALPQFALVSLDSAAFTQAVQQHCGDPVAVRQRVTQAFGAVTEVMVERYELPVNYMRMSEVRVDLVQPQRNWLQVQPVVSLLCGLGNATLQASVSGSVTQANQMLSVLVVSALADTMPPLDYRLGATAVTEDEHQILLHAQPLVSVAILPGGKNWPVLSLGEDGRIYAGGKVIEAATGRLLVQSEATFVLPYGVEVTALAHGYRLRRSGKECQLSSQELQLNSNKTASQALQDRNLVLTSSVNGLLALVTQFDAEGLVSDYLIESVDIANCKVSVTQHLGNPDLLVELGQSASGGWWLTGSIEQTLLRSTDRRQWQKVSLPAELSSLVSSYVVDDREIWLAAILPDVKPSPYLLVYSNDGGEHWRNLAQDDPLLIKIPTAWLEGQKRRVPQP